MRVFIGIFTTCDRKGRVDGPLSSVNYRRIVRRPAACLLSWLAAWHLTGERRLTDTDNAEMHVRVAVGRVVRNVTP